MGQRRREFSVRGSFSLQCFGLRLKHTHRIRATGEPGWRYIQASQLHDGTRQLGRVTALLPTHATPGVNSGLAAVRIIRDAVVSGEYGMADAYDRKRNEVLDWLQDPDERVRTFAANYVNELQVMSDSERRRADESIAVRKFEYGEE